MKSYNSAILQFCNSAILQSTTNKQQPTTNNQQQITNNQKPTTIKQQPTTNKKNNKQPNNYRIEKTLKKKSHIENKGVTFYVKYAGKLPM